MNHKLQVKICVVDDEEIIRVSLSDDLRDWGFTVFEFENPLEALEFIRFEKVNIVITDIKMPDMDGITLLKEIKAFKPEVYIITMTAFGSVKNAVEALKLGAYDYFTKPYDSDELKNLLMQIIEIDFLKTANQQFSSHFQAKYSFESYWGESKKAKELKKQLVLIANKDSSVLIKGETGTGKELIANIIHYNSKRKNKPLVKVSCAILAREVFESELFGHERGAFTGAEKTRKGRFEEAEGGTIFLDDVDDIPIDLQVKLLRVLQENEFERVGGNKPIKLDIRILASTKVDLLKLVEQGKFREDLYYRINIFPLEIAALSERKEDIKLLFERFLKLYCSNCSFTVDEKVYTILENYPWPGNTRELKNLVERLSIIATDGKITIENLPYEYCATEILSSQYELGEKNLAALVADYEIRTIRLALTKSSGNKNKAAELLGIPVSTLRSKIEKHNLN